MFHSVRNARSNQGRHRRIRKKRRRLLVETLEVRHLLAGAEPPNVLSVVRADLNPTNASQVDFNVLFDESVTGVDAGDFQLATTGAVSGATIGAVTGTGASYTVTVNAGSGEGTIRLDVIDNNSIKDLQNDKLGGNGPNNGDFLSGEVYTLDYTAPTANGPPLVNAPSASSATVDYNITFSEDVQGVDAGDFTLTTNGVAGASISNVSGSGSNYTIEVTTGSGEGDVQLSLTDNDTITDLAGNVLAGVGASPPLDGSLHSVDRLAPDVVSITALGTDPTNASFVDFEVVFSEPVVNVGQEDFQLAGTGVSGAVITSVSGANTTFTVSTSTGSGDGTIQLGMLAAATVSDVAGNALPSSDVVSQIVEVDKTLSISMAQAVVGSAYTFAGSVQYTVTFPEPMLGITADVFETHTPGTNSTLTGTSVNSVTGSGDQYTVTLGTGTGDGLLGLRLTNGAGTARDLAGNVATIIYGSGTIFQIDRTAPSIESVALVSPALTNQSELAFDVEFSEQVLGLAASDFDLVTTGSLAGESIASVAPNGVLTSYRVTVNVPEGSGTLSIASTTTGSGADSAGNGLASPQSGWPAYTIESSTISGRVRLDQDGDGLVDVGDAGLAGVTVYLDANDNGQFDGGETSTVTASDDPGTVDVNEAGEYSLTSLFAGDYSVRIVPGSNQIPSSPTGRGTGSGDLQHRESIASPLNQSWVSPKSLMVSNDGNLAVGVWSSGDEVALYDRDSIDGTLTLVDSVDVPDAFGGGVASLSPDGSMVYVPGRNVDAISWLSIDGSGLTLLGSISATSMGNDLLDQVEHLTVSPDGQTLVATTGMNRVLAFDIEADGSLTPAQTFTDGIELTGLLNPQLAKFNPSGDQLVVVSLNDQGLHFFDRDTATGTISVGQARETLWGVSGAIFSDDGQTLYASSRQNRVYTLQLDEMTGEFATAETLVLPDEIDPYRIERSPDGRSLLLSSELADSISRVEIDDTSGALSLQQTFTNIIDLDDLDSPESIEVSPDGRSVYVSAFGSQRLHHFNLDTGQRPPVAMTVSTDGVNTVDDVDFSLKTEAPVLLSLDRLNGPIASADQIAFRATFSEAVTGVTTDDFRLVLTDHPTDNITSVSGSGSVYDVTVDVTGAQGDVAIEAVDRDAILDADNVPTGGIGIGSILARSPVTHVDPIAPTVVSIASQENPVAGATTHAFFVVFSEPITGLLAGDLAIVVGGGVTSPVIASISVQGSIARVVVESVGSDGTLRLDLIDRDTIVDSAGNPLDGMGTTGAQDGSVTGATLTLSSPSIHGRLFFDSDQDGLHDSAEAGRGNATVYLDANANGLWDTGELTVTTSADDAATTEVDEAGYYSFVGLAPGTDYIVGVQDGFTVTQPLSYAVDDGTLTHVESIVAGTLPDNFLHSPTRVSISPDGRHVYSTALNGHAVAVFDRMPGEDLSLVEYYKTGDAGFTYISAPEEIVFDSTGMFGVLSTKDSLYVFERDASDGTLAVLHRFEEGVAGFEGVSDLDYIAISPNDQTLYAVSSVHDRLLVLSIDPVDRSLTVLQRFQHLVDGVANLDEPNAVTLSPDGQQLFVSARNSRTVSVFDVASPSGELMLAQTLAATGFSHAGTSVVTDDGLDFYVAERFSSGVHHYRRSSLNTPWAHVSEFIKPTTSAYAMLLSPDGGYLYLASSTSDQIVVLNRDLSSGALGLVETLDDVAPHDTLDNVYDLAITPSGDELLAVAWTDNALTRFSRLSGATSPEPVSITTARQTNQVPSIGVFNEPPTIVSIQTTATGPTAAASLDYTVTFSEAVSGLDVTDLQVIAPELTGVEVTGISGGPIEYIVTVNTGEGAGDLQLRLVDDETVIDSAGDALDGSGDGSLTSSVIQVDREPPAVLSIMRTDANPTVQTSMQFTVTFSEAVQNVALADFAATGSGLLGVQLDSISGSGDTYTVTVSHSGTSGTLGLDFVDDDSVSDSVGNLLGGVGANNGDFAGQTYTVLPPLSASLAVTTNGNETGPVDLVYTASLNRANDTGSAITFELDDLGLGASTADADYQAISDGAQIVIADGAVSGTVTVPVLEDGLVEGSETLQLQISSPSNPGVSIDTASAVGTIADNDMATLALVLADGSISENGGTTTATISRNTDTSNSLVVSIASDDESEATGASTITIAAGQTDSAPFAITAIDDDLVDGDQSVQLTVSVTGFISGSQTLTVTDYEALSLQIDSSPIAENGTASATVTRTDPNGDLLVTLGSSDTGELSVPTQVLIPDGALTSVAIAILGVTDSLVDGDQAVSMSANAPGYLGASAPVLISDVDVATLELALASLSITESGQTTATVSRNTDTTGSLVVSLLSSDMDVATVPGTVTIPAGQATSNPFVILGVDEGLVDGLETATITASATSFADANASIDVGNDTVNQDPILTFGGASPSYTHGQAPSPIAPSADLNDPDSPNFEGGSLQITIVAGGQAGDQLAIANQGVGAGQVGLAGGDVSYEETVIGTVSGGLASTPLSVSFNASATVEAVQAVLRAATFSNDSLTSSTIQRELEVQLTDGDGGTAGTVGGSPSFAYSVGFGGASFDRVESLGYDAAGNVYISGYFRGTADFDPSAGVTELSTSVATRADAFIASYDGAGLLRWARQVGSAGNDFAYDMAVDAAGNVAVVGSFEGTVDLDPGAGETLLTSTSLSDGYLLRLNQAGDFIDVAQFPATPNSVTFKSNGDLLVSGNYGDAEDFDPGPGVQLLPESTGTDVFLVSLDSNLAFQWARTTRTTAERGAFSSDLAVDDSGNIIVVGTFNGTVDFDPSPSELLLSTATTETFDLDGFVWKLSPTGDLLWTKSWGGEDYDTINEVAINSAGDIYTTGWIDEYPGGTLVDMDPGPGTFHVNSAGSWDLFVSKLDASGDFQWAAATGSTSIDQGWSLDLDSSGNVHAGVYFTGTVDFDPGPATESASTIGSGDIGIWSLDPSGDLLDFTTVGGSSAEYPFALEIGQQDTIYFGGQFSTSVDFDPSVDDSTLVSNGDGDAYLAKWQAGAGQTPTVVVTQIPVFDFGDAPSSTLAGGTFVSDYPVTLADDGARHFDTGPRLGSSRDHEVEGTASLLADADDSNGIDDEDGVVFATALFVKSSSATQGSVSIDLQNADVASNRLDAWIDFNRDGDWTDSGEQVFTNFDLGTSNGVQTLTFTIPQDLGNNVVIGDSYARFRVSTAGSLSPTGAANDGEVEDYLVSIAETPLLTVDVAATTLSELDGSSATTVTITRNSGIASAIDVMLRSSDPTEASIQSTATIPAGQTWVTVDLAAADDLVADGDQTVTIFANTLDSGGDIGLDANFGIAGLATTPLEMSVQPPKLAMALQSDGKVVAASEGASGGDLKLTRLLPDGSPDFAFGTNGLVIDSLGFDSALPQRVLFQNDGKILVGGLFIDSGTRTPMLVRYNADGTRDSSYGSNGLANLASLGNMWIEDMGFTPEGKVLSALGVNGAVAFRATQVNVDGTLDTNFGGFGTGVATYSTNDVTASAIKPLPDGRFLLVGEDVGSGKVIRSDATGFIDPSFGNSGVQTIDFGTGATFTRFHSIRVDQNDRIVIGSFVADGNDTGDFATARLNSDGSFDTTFDNDGMVVTDVLSGRDDLTSSLQVQPNGKVVAVGYSEAVGGNEVSIVRYNENGSLDATFDGDGIYQFTAGSSTNQWSFGSALDSMDGGLMVLAGWGTDFQVARINMGGLEGTDTVDVIDNEPVSGPFVVDTLTDEDDGDYSIGDFSLREAIRLANSYAGADSIQFAAGLSGGTITLTVDQLSVSDDLNIMGLGPSNLALSGGDSFRVFDFQGSPDATIDGLTITSGLSSAIGQRGGAIRSTGDLQVINSVVSNSSVTASSADGGGIAHSGGELTIANSTIAGNSTTQTNASGAGVSVVSGNLIVSDSTINNNATAGGAGAGIIVQFGDATVTSSTISNNTAGGTGVAAGGLLVINGNLDIESSTISGNTSDGIGAGVLFSGTTANVTNSTISGNQSTNEVGGGVYAYSGTLNITHSTITANSGTSGSGVVGHDDGAGNVASVNVLSSVIAGNTGGDVANVLSGSGSNTFNSSGFNLVGLGNAVAAFDQGTDQTGIANPELGPLAGNGGPTQTHALLANSLAIGTGDTTSSGLTDQRGTGFERVVGSNMDVGAFELQATSPSVTLSLDNANIPEASGVSIFTVTLSEISGEDVTVNLGFSGTATLTDDYTLGDTVLLIPSGELTANTTVTAVQDVLDDEAETIVVDIVSVANGDEDGTQQQITTIIDDDEATPELTVAIAEASISENGGVTTATVSRNSDTTGDLSVTLISSDPGEASVPATIVILAGQSVSAPFDITGIADVFVDGTQTVTITASAGAHVDGSETLEVIDDDVPTLSVSIVESAISENGGSATATVSRNTDTTEALIVTLSSDDPGEASVPTTVTIPAGQLTSAPFAITGVDDVVADGTQTVTITASTASRSATQYLDEFSDASINPFWSVDLGIPSSTITSPDGILRIHSPVAPSSHLDTRLESAMVFSDSDFEATVDFRIPEGNAMAWLGLVERPGDQSDSEHYGLYFFDASNYWVWLDDNTFVGSKFVRDGFGDERTQWHQLKISYDADSKTTTSFVDGVSVNSEVVNLDRAVVYLNMKDATDYGEGPTTIEFDNFAFTYDAEFVFGSDSIDVTDDGDVNVTQTITGTQFEDLDLDGNLDAGEPPIEGITVYVDLNNNGMLDGGEPSGVSGSDGVYEIQNVPQGEHWIRTEWPAQFRPSTYHSVSDRLVATRDVTDANSSTNESLWVRQIDPQDGTWLSDLPTDIPVINPSSSTTDGTYIYVIDNNRDVLIQLTPQGGLVHETPIPPISTGAIPHSQGPAVVDGTVYWITGTEFAIHEYDPKSGSILGSRPITIDPSVTSLQGVIPPSGNLVESPDGTAIWIFANADDRVLVLDPQTAQIVDVFNFQVTSNGVWSAASLNGELFIRGGVTGNALSVYDSSLNFIRSIAGPSSPGLAGGTFYEYGTRLDVNVLDTLNRGYESMSGTVSGVVGADLNGDGLIDGGEIPIEGVTVFIDANGNHWPDAGEVSTLSAADGSYTLSGFAPGTHQVSVLPPAGYRASNAYSSTGRLFGSSLSSADQPQGSYVAVISELDPQSGAILHQNVTTVPLVNGNIGLSFTGDHLILTDNTSDILYELTVDGQIIDSRPLGEPFVNPTNGQTEYTSANDYGSEVLGGSIFSVREGVNSHLNLIEYDVLTNQFLRERPLTYDFGLTETAGTYNPSAPTPLSSFSRSVDGGSLVLSTSDGFRILIDPETAIATLPKPTDPYWGSTNYASASLNGEGFISFSGAVHVVDDSYQVLRTLRSIPTPFGLAAGQHRIASAVTAVGENETVNLDLGLLPTTVTLNGTVINDADNDRVLDPEESPADGLTVYLDLNLNQSFDANEPTATTDSQGNYTFSGVLPGEYDVRVIHPANSLARAWTGPDTRVFAYVAYQGQDAVIQELDPITAEILNEFPSPYPTNLAVGLAADTNWLYLSRSGGIDILSRDDGTVMGTIHAPEADGLAILGERAYLSSSTTDQIHVVDLVRRRVVDSWDLGEINFGSPSLYQFQGSLAEAPDGVNLLVSLTGGDALVVDPNTGIIVDEWTSVFLNGGAGGAGGELFEPRIYSGSDLISYNARNEIGLSVRTMIATGLGIPYGIASTTVEATSHRIRVYEEQSLAAMDFGIVADSQTVSGTQFVDANSNGVFDAGESPLEGVTVYADLNSNQAFDVGEPNAVSAADGSYTLNGLPHSTVWLRTQASGYTSTQSLGAQTQLLGTDRAADASSPTGYYLAIRELDPQTGAQLVYRKTDVPITQATSASWVGERLVFVDNVQDKIVQVSRQGQLLSETALPESDGSVASAIGTAVIDQTLYVGLSGGGGPLRLSRYDLEAQSFYGTMPVSADLNQTGVSDPLPSLSLAVTETPDGESILLFANLDDRVFILDPKTARITTTLTIPDTGGNLYSAATINNELYLRGQSTGSQTQIFNDQYAFVRSIPGVPNQGLDGSVDPAWGVAVDVTATSLSGVDIGQHPTFTNLSGVVTIDSNYDGIADVGEVAAGVTVYLDTNRNGTLDVGELSTTSLADGSYHFEQLPPGDYFVSVQHDPSTQRVTTTVNHTRLYSLEVVDGVSTIRRHDEITGQELASFPAPGAPTLIAGLAADERAVYYSKPEGVYVLDPFSGETEYFFDLPDGDYQGLAAINGLVYVLDSSDGVITGLDVESGIVLASMDLNAINESGHVFSNALGESLDGTRLVTRNANGERLVVDPSSGVIESVWPSTNGVASLAGSADEFFVPFSSSILAQNLEGQTARALPVGFYSHGLAAVTTTSDTYAVRATMDQDFTQLDFHLVNPPSWPGLSISGVLWQDDDSDGQFDLGESGIAGRTVFIDLNDDGQLNGNEPSQVTLADDAQTAANEAGTYRFTELAPGQPLAAGQYTIREVLPANWQATTPVASVSLSAEGTVASASLGSNPPEAPTAVIPSNTSISENVDTSASDLLFAQLAASDPDAGDTHTFALVSGEGDSDNHRFNIVNGNLMLNSGEVVDFEIQSSYSIRVLVTDSAGLTSELNTILQVENVVEVMADEIEFDGSTVQRSRLGTLSVKFDSSVTIDSDAFTIEKLGPEGGNVPLTFTTRTEADGSMYADLVFSGSYVEYGSLVDGNYQLTVDGSKITLGDGSKFDGDGDGTEGGMMVWGDEAADGFYRFYGDVDGDRDVDARDLRQIKSSYQKSIGDPGYLAAFDYDGDGDVDARDSRQFKRIYQTNLPF